MFGTIAEGRHSLGPSEFGLVDVWSWPLADTGRNALDAELPARKARIPGVPTDGNRPKVSSLPKYFASTPTTVAITRPDVPCELQRRAKKDTIDKKGA